MKTKIELVKRWGDILQETIAHTPELHKLYSDPERNKKYDFNPGLHSKYRDLAVLDYLLNRNSVSFKENLRKAVPFEIEVMEKYDEGVPIHPSLMSMDRYKELFNALASGDMALAPYFSKVVASKLINLKWGR